MNVEESETEQNGGLSIQNRELQSNGDDSQLDASFKDEGKPRVIILFLALKIKHNKKKLL